MYWDMHRHRRHRHLELEASPQPPWRAPRATPATVRSFLRALPRAVVTHDQADTESLRRLVERSTELLGGVSAPGVARRRLQEVESPDGPSSLSGDGRFMVGHPDRTEGHRHHPRLP